MEKLLNQLQGASAPDPASPRGDASAGSPGVAAKKNARAAMAHLRANVTELVDRDAAVRATLDEVLQFVPAYLIESCGEISHTGRTLRQLLGPGSEAILPADDRSMPAERLASALLLWARKRLCRSQTRKWLCGTAGSVTKLTSKLRQKMSSRPPYAYPTQATQRLIIYQVLHTARRGVTALTITITTTLSLSLSLIVTRERRSCATGSARCRGPTGPPNPAYTTCASGQWTFGTRCRRARQRAPPSQRS